MVELKWHPEDLERLTLIQLRCLVEKEPPDAPTVRMASSFEEWLAIQAEVRELEAAANADW
jgi:hypothetical protein